MLGLGGDGGGGVWPLPRGHLPGGSSPWPLYSDRWDRRCLLGTVRATALMCFVPEGVKTPCGHHHGKGEVQIKCDSEVQDVSEVKRSTLVGAGVAMPEASVPFSLPVACEEASGTPGALWHAA